eukprot:7409801-Alexandrium_andersonii.AAC.1
MAETACGTQQARRAKRPCPALGSRQKSATPSVVALSTGGAARSAAPLARSTDISGSPISVDP